MKYIRCLILVWFSLLLQACPQIPVAPEQNVLLNVAVLQEQKVVYLADSTQADPKLEVSTTLLNFGTSTNELQVVISNAGGQTLDWNVSNIPNWLQLSQTSGTNRLYVNATIDREHMQAGTFEESFTVNSNYGTETITAKVEVVEDFTAWWVVPMIEDALVTTDADYDTVTASEAFQVEKSGWYRFKTTQIDGEGSKNQLDESYVILARERETGNFALMSDADVVGVTVSEVGRNLDIKFVVDFSKGYTGPKTSNCGTYLLQEGKSYDLFMFHAVKARNYMNPRDIHQNFSGPNSVKLSAAYAQEVEQ